MPEAVLFDLDGTLVTYAAPYADFLDASAIRWGITDPNDPFHAAYASAIKSEGPVTFQSAIQQALQATDRPIPQDISEQSQAAVAEYANGIQLLPGALQLIGKYARLPKAIVSNGPADMQRAALAAANLTHLFDHILISGDEDVAVRKPNAAIFHLACHRLGKGPDRTLMIGDNLEADIEGARAAGLMAIHMRT